MDTTSTRGEELLARSDKTQPPLTDLEITAISSHLDRLEPSKVCLFGTDKVYQSKDLGIGVKKDRATQFQKALSFSASRHNDNKHVNLAAEHFDLQTQKEAFQFVKSDVRIETNLKYPRAWIRLRGIRRTFYHYQLYGAFWLLKEERGHRRGAILADLMGLGKTTTSYLYILLNFFLAENAEDIRTHPERHCRQTTNHGYTQPEDARCPSQDDWPIVCACEEYSLTACLSLTPRDGATLILLPASLIGRWQSEWKAMGVDKSLGLRLYIHHNDYPKRYISKSKLVHVTLRKIEGEGVTARMAAPVSNIAHRFIVLTTVESYFTHVQLYCKARRQWNPTPGYAWEKDHTDGLAWGRVLRDEAHLTPNWPTTVYRILESLAHNGWIAPNFVAITATPMLRNGVVDMLACVRIINLFSSTISKHRDCAKYAESSQLDKLTAIYEEMQKDRLGRRAGSDTVDHDDLTQTIGQLQAAYCIRRGNDSVQNDKALAWVPPLECYDVLCSVVGETNVYQIQCIEGMLKSHLSRAMAHQLRIRGDCSVQLLLDNAVTPRILASVPGLTRYKTRKVLTWTHIKQNRWHQAAENSPIYADIDLLLKGSGKLQKLRELLQALDYDADNEPESLVVVSEFPIICLVVLCFCLSEGVPSDWMHADLSVEKREALVGVFQGSRKADSTVGRGHPFRVLVGSSRLLGQGVTLNKANRLVLMEPGWHAGVEAQIADRVHRIGSRTDRCWFYRLINSASTLERLLVDDQEGQVQQQLLIDWFNGAREIEHGGDVDLAQFLGYGESGYEASGGNEEEETEDMLDM